MAELIVSRDDLSPLRATAGSLARVPWATVVDQLADAVGVGLVAVMAGVARETVSRWRNGQSGRPRADSERQVREAYRIYRDLAESDSDPTIRAWFMGSNSYLGDDSPAEAIGRGEARAVLAAAEAFRNA
jgi:transcriptional regulator with XRE-family HTH domain